MSEQSKAKELINYSFLVVFANDSTIDKDELKFIERLALEDHIIDDNEKEVLRNIFSRVEKNQLEPDVLEEIEVFRKRYSI